MTDRTDWFTESDAEKAARTLDPEAWAILDSDSIGMMTRRKVSLEQARKALSAVDPFEWREIAKMDPKPGDEILICGGDYKYTGDTFPSWVPFEGTAIAFYLRGEWIGDNGPDLDGHYVHRPTLWMPKPLPPHRRASE